MTSLKNNSISVISIPGSSGAKVVVTPTYSPEYFRIFVLYYFTLYFIMGTAVNFVAGDNQTSALQRLTYANGKYTIKGVGIATSAIFFCSRSSFSV